MSQFSITRIAGDKNWCTSIEFIIQVSNEIRKTFFLGSATSQFSFPAAGDVKITSRDDTSNFFLGSVTLNSSLVPEHGVFWLPLYRRTEDRVKEIPCRGTAPIWLELTPVEMHLHTVVEVSELSGSEPVTLNSLDIPEGDYSQSLLEEERRKVKDLESQLINARKEIAQKDEWIQELEGEVLKKDKLLVQTNQELQRLRLENSQIRENNTKPKVSSPIPGTRSPTDRKKIVRWNSDIRDAGKTTPEPKPTRGKIDQVDAALRKKLREIGKSSLFVREEENIYSVGKRKVFVEIREGKPVCRAGGGFKSIEEYIRDVEVSNNLNSKKSSHVYGLYA